jgi:hypothetical protein
MIGGKYIGNGGTQLAVKVEQVKASMETKDTQRTDKGCRGLRHGII